LRDKRSAVYLVNTINKKYAKIYEQNVRAMLEQTGDPNIITLVRAREKTSPHAPHRASAGTDAA
jgi:hypothetical protein